MVVGYFKAISWWCKNDTTYTLLPTSGNDQTRDSSLESNSPYSEKDTQLVNQSPSSRIDPRIVSDAIIGLSDGLTVPFALTAGLSALGDTKLVVYGGLAELIAGSISMGLGGYLGAVSEAQSYQATLSETKTMVSQNYENTRDLVDSTFRDFGFSDDLLDAMTTQLCSSKDNTSKFLMRFHHQLPESSHTPRRAYISALTIAVGYLLGGLTPLVPYFIFDKNRTAFFWSVAVMAVALFAFGYVKTFAVGETRKGPCLKAGLQMMVLGGVAAAAAMGCVKAFE